MDALLGDRTFAAVLFDMDGTLVDSTAVVNRSWATWAEEFGVDPAALVGFHGVPAGAIVPTVLEAAQQAAATQRIVDLEMADTEGVVALPGAEDALLEVADGGGRYAIVTSCLRPLYAVRMEASRLTPPDTSVTADEVAHGKPAPDPYLLGAERLGVDPADSLVVEDALQGLRSAKDAGCATLAVVSTATREELEESGLADAVVETLADVRFVVGEDRRTRVVTAR